MEKNGNTAIYLYCKYNATMTSAIGDLYPIFPIFAPISYHT